MRILSCKYCTCVFLPCVCCRKEQISGWRVTICRRHENELMCSLYSLRAFHFRFCNLKTPFATKQAFMGMWYVTGGSPSFLRIEGNATVALPTTNQNNKCYSFLCSTGLPSLDLSHYARANLRAFTQDINRSNIVPQSYDVIQPKTDIVQQRYLSMPSNNHKKNEMRRPPWISASKQRNKNSSHMNTREPEVLQSVLLMQVQVLFLMMIEVGG